MKFDFESLSAEPLFYMLMHSVAFVTVLGVIFFIVGLLFGYATWGRYKRQTRELRGETGALKQEVADLKRKLGEHTLKSGPSVAIATETIHMPRNGGGDTPPATAGPASDNAAPVKDNRLPLAEAARPPSTARRTQAQTGAIKVKTASIKPRIAALSPQPADIEDPVKAPEPVKRITASVKLPTLAETPPPPPAPARHASPLAAIVASAPALEKKEGPAVPDSITAPQDAPATPAAELPVAPLPAVVIIPELDPRLGLIYKTKPDKTDDLTAIKGVGDTFQERLHEFGIYTYEQIATWNEDQIREFSARLAFKDRIQRERWVEQAQHLVSQKVTAMA